MTWLDKRNGLDKTRSAAMKLVANDLVGNDFNGTRVNVDTIRPEDLQSDDVHGSGLFTTYREQIITQAQNLKKWGLAQAAAHPLPLRVETSFGAAVPIGQTQVINVRVVDANGVGIEGMPLWLDTAKSSTDAQFSWTGGTRDNPNAMTNASGAASLTAVPTTTSHYFGVINTWGPRELVIALPTDGSQRAMAVSTKVTESPKFDFATAAAPTTVPNQTTTAPATTTTQPTTTTTQPPVSSDVTGAATMYCPPAGSMIFSFLVEVWDWNAANGNQLNPASQYFFGIQGNRIQIPWVDMMGLSGNRGFFSMTTYVTAVPGQTSWDYTFSGPNLAITSGSTGIPASCMPATTTTTTTTTTTAPTTTTVPVTVQTTTTQPTTTTTTTKPTTTTSTTTSTTSSTTTTTTKPTTTTSSTTTSTTKPTTTTSTTSTTSTTTTTMPTSTTSTTLPMPNVNAEVSCAPTAGSPYPTTVTITDATPGQSYVVKVGTGSTTFTYDSNMYVTKFGLAGNKGDSVTLLIVGGKFGDTGESVVVTLGDVCATTTTVPVSVQGTTATTIRVVATTQPATVVAGNTLARTGFSSAGLIASGLMAIGAGLATLGLFQAAEKKRFARVA